MRRILIFLWVLTLAGLFTACRHNVVYSHFTPIPSEGWYVDTVPQFDFVIEDKEAHYDLLIYIRHTERYPYQNMWLFVEDDRLHRDTIEFYLADDRGQWLGDRHHGFIEMPVLYESRYQFPDTGHYSISVVQAMRDTLLRGVTDVGMEVLRAEN